MSTNGHAPHLPSSDPSKRGGWKSAIYIIFVEMAERFAYYGTAGNLFMYLTTVLGEPAATAAKSVNIWVGVSSLFPLLGAFIADSYLGRFRTILYSSSTFLFGLILLTISVSVVPRHNRRAAFYTALYILSVGEGGHKPCVQTFAADQFDEDTPEERRTKTSFFNWWYLGIVVGATVAVFIVIYVEDYVGWAAGFGMLAAALAAALALFIIGIPTYRRQRPAGSPFTRVAQVFVAAARKRRVRGTRRLETGGYAENGSDPGKARTLARTDQFRWLDKASVVDEVDERLDVVRDPWRLCTQTQVEEVKLVIRLIPILLCCFMFAIDTAQFSTFFTKQSSTMQLSVGPCFHVAPASFQAFTGLTILVFVLAYERFFVPLARAITGHPNGITVLQRMGAGLFMGTLNMVVCALIEGKRLRVAKAHGLLDMPKATVPMPVWWLIPQYIIMGLADALMIVGMQELFYDQMPEQLRSLGAALQISTTGVGNLLSSAVISIVQVATGASGLHKKWLTNNLNRAHLDRFYWLLAVLSVLNLSVYVFVARRFLYKKVEGPLGNMESDKSPLHLEGGVAKT